jgi:hypothetical protein
MNNVIKKMAIALGMIAIVLQACKKEEKPIVKPDPAADFRAKFCNVWWNLDSITIEDNHTIMPNPGQKVKFCYPGDSILSVDKTGNASQHNSDWKYVDPKHFDVVTKGTTQHGEVITLTDKRFIFSAVVDSLKETGYTSR